MPSSLTSRDMEEFRGNIRGMRNDLTASRRRRLRLLPSPEIDARQDEDAAQMQRPELLGLVFRSIESRRLLETDGLNARPTETLKGHPPPVLA